MTGSLPHLKRILVYLLHTHFDIGCDLQMLKIKEQTTNIIQL